MSIHDSILCQLFCVVVVSHMASPKTYTATYSTLYQSMSMSMTVYATTVHRTDVLQIQVCLLRLFCLLRVLQTDGIVSYRPTLMSVSILTAIKLL